MRAKIALPVLMTVLVGIVLLLEAQPGASAPQKGGPGKKEFKFDPNDIFEKWYSKGRGYFMIEEAKKGRDELQAWAKDNGVTDGKITKEMYLKYWAFREEQRSKGDNPRKDGPKKDEGSAKKDEGPKKGPPDNADIDAKATELFNRYDTNGDGFLNAEEISKTQRFKDEWEKWDANGDKLISLAEWRAYFRDTMQRKQAAREERDAKKDEAKKTTTPKTGAIVIEEDDDPQRLIYLAGTKLPADVPPWFKELDKDKDGQVSLFEWNAAGKDIEEFVKMDRNDDGYLTVEEVLHYQRYVVTNGTPRPDQVATITPPQKRPDGTSQDGNKRDGNNKKKKGPRGP
jgi:Ca2+-binding EF-hand superfamily protein